MSPYEIGIWVFMLAAFLGFELIRRVSPLLHTPLMSLTNAISAIAVVGAILITGDTAPDRIREASSSGCFLMHKPVSNSKLRAAINNLTIAK